MRPDTLAVIGLGAIGGSVAWHAARAGIPRILGYALSPADGVAAARAGAVTEVSTRAEQAVERADLVVLAAPPRATLDLIDRLAPALSARRCLCADVSSVKTAIVRRAVARGLTELFAGSHPFAGTHESGFTAARPDMFAGEIVYVTPAEGGERAGAEVADFWERVIGAHPVIMTPERHDMFVAWTSHLPQAVASALAVALAEHSPDGARVGAGARSTTRLAASSVSMWTDVLLLNREPVLEALEGLDRAVGTLRKALDAGDAAAIGEWLQSGHAWRRQLDR